MKFWFGLRLEAVTPFYILSTKKTKELDQANWRQAKQEKINVQPKLKPKPKPKPAILKMPFVHMYIFRYMLVFERVTVAH